jgi:biopolymer transport protein ExbD
MKFPRNARIFRGQLDAAPFAIVFFLLVMFLMLGSLMYTPGVHLDLPIADNLAGTDRPSVVVAIDAAGRFYYQNEVVEDNALRSKLRMAAQECLEPLTLVVQADRAATADMILRATLLARDAGITNGMWATLPSPLVAVPVSKR